MEDQKKSNNIVSNIWRNWCQLDPQQRSQVADRLGPVGHMLSIAANVTQFAQNGAEVLSGTQAPPQGSSTAQNDRDPTQTSTSRDVDDDEDIIDAEFEECDP